MINDIFGVYHKPVHIVGFPRERWQSHMENIPLDHLDLEEILEASYHLFPGGYGDVDVFRYMLKRTLPYFLSIYGSADIECNTPGCHENVSKSRLQEDSLKEEIVRLNSDLCAQWRKSLRKEEVFVINEIFEYACYAKFNTDNKISPFFFTLFLIWGKDCEQLFSYFRSNYPKQSIEELRDRISMVVHVYKDAPTKSPLLLLLGTLYCNNKYIEEQFQDLIYDSWFNESIILRDDDISQYFTNHECVSADNFLLQFISGTN